MAAQPRGDRFSNVIRTGWKPAGPSSPDDPMITLSAFADEIATDPVEQLDVLERHGIRYLEFRSIHDTNVMKLTAAQHEGFRELLRSRGFGLSAIGSPIGKIRIDEPFEPHLADFERAMDLAEFYGTPRIRIFSYYMPQEPTPPPDPATFRDEVLKRMTAKVKRAEQRGLTLVLENEKFLYGDTADRVADLLETIDSPALGHAFDPANYLEVGQDPQAAWDRLKSRVIHFHVKDYDTTLHKNVPAGEGQGRIPELIADAVRSGYRGFCVLEPHLVVAELTRGFTGPERFGDAVAALKNGLQRYNVPIA